MCASSCVPSEELWSDPEKLMKCCPSLLCEIILKAWQLLAMICTWVFNISVSHTLLWVFYFVPTKHTHGFTTKFQDIWSKLKELFCLKEDTVKCNTTKDIIIQVILKMNDKEILLQIFCDYWASCQAPPSQHFVYPTVVRIQQILFYFNQGKRGHLGIRITQFCSTLHSIGKLPLCFGNRITNASFAQNVHSLPWKLCLKHVLLTSKCSAKYQLLDKV